MLIYSLLFLVSIFFDLFLKYLAVNILPVDGFYFYKNYIGLDLYFNKYIAFSIPINTIFLYIVNITIIAIIVYVFLSKIRKKNTSKYVFYQLFFITLLLSGAVANLINRFVYGYVIDYIVVGKFPVFNLADITIVIGTIGWLGLEYVLDKRINPRSSTDRTIPS